MGKLKFEDLNISKEIQKAITDMGFEEPSPIQAQAIPYIIEGMDVVGQAQTGTGKTGAFGIPVLDIVDLHNKKIQAIILCPTRELALQVAEEIRKLAKYKKDTKVLPVYGGQPIERQIQALKKGVQIIIGTPGRVMDHIERRTLKMESIKIVVLDEADEMLDMGFIDDIETILKKIPEERQALLFSATMPKEILELTKKYQKDPKIVKVVHKQMTVPNIEQIYYELKGKSKPEILSRVIDMYDPKLSMVFCNTKRKVDELVAELQTRGYSAEGLHGDMRQQQRDRVMNKFRKGDIDILVATDVAARGIDVDDVEAVFNYDVPQDEEYYVHRIGRTARAGRTGRAFTFVVGREIYKLRDIQKYTKTKIALHQVPSIGDIEEIKINALLDRVRSAIKEGGLAKYAHLIENLVEEDITSLDVAAALLKMSVDSREDELGEDNLEETGAGPGMVRMFINVGRNQRVGARDIVGAISANANIPGRVIGTIDIFDKYTFVEVPREYARDVLTMMKDNQIKGRKVNIEPANRH